MEVLGRDSAREAYRVAISTPAGRVVGLIPEHMIANGIALTGGRGHQTAYDWIAARSAKIEQTLIAMANGGAPARAPFDQLTLEEDPNHAY